MFKLTSIIAALLVIAVGSSFALAQSQNSKTSSSQSDRDAAQRERDQVQRDKEQVQRDADRARDQAQREKDQAQRTKEQMQRSYERVRAAPYERSDNMKKVRGSFLGVNTSSIPTVVQLQLKLPRNMGLSVDSVEPQSPAETASVHKYDIIMKLNDQMLLDSHHLAVLLRTLKPGDEITLSIIRLGENTTVKVKLSEKEILVPDDGTHTDATEEKHISPGDLEN